MTQAEWLNATDPLPMLESLPTSGKLSDRKARLFAAVCCRRIWPLLTDERSRWAVEATEWYADGELDAEDIRDAGNEAYRAWEDASSVPDDPGEPPDKA